MALITVRLWRNYSETDVTDVAAIAEYQTFKTPEERGFDPPEGKAFKEWNSQSDGSGTSYSPDDTIPKTYSTYYAIWEEIPEPIKYLTNDQSLTAVANAIRAKGGTSAQLVYPAGFVSAIDAIQTGTDVSDTTATAADVLSGKYFYNASGTKTQGSIASKTSSDLTSSGATVNVPAGHYASAASKTIASGSATTPATTITAAPSISVNASGLITATNSKTQNVTPTVSAGYVSAGTAGTITVNGSNTSQLATQDAQTIIPGTTDQTIQSGKYLTGTQTIKGDANLVAANIAKNTTIFGVTGTHTGGATITDTTDSHGGTIRNIDTESATTIEPLSVTENGTYTAPSGKAYSPVTVDVSGSGGNVTTVEFGDDSVFTADYIGYVDGNGDYQYATSLAVMSAVSYQMLAGSILCTIHGVDPAMSGAFMNLPSTLTLVATHTAGPSKSCIYTWIFQVAQ